MLSLELCRCSADLFSVQQTTYRIGNRVFKLGMVVARSVNVKKATTSNDILSSTTERLVAVHGLSERTTVQTSSLLLRLFFLTSSPNRPNPTHIANANPDPHPS